MAATQRHLSECVGKFYRNIESGWVGKVIEIDDSQPDTPFKMMGVDGLAHAVVGGTLEDNLTKDDIQWFDPRDMVEVRGG